MITFEYFEIFYYLISLSFLLLLLVLINIIFIIKNNYIEKITAYECGFQTFEYSITNFDIKFYIIAVLFLLFDLELIFFLPFILALNFMCFQAIITIIFFFILLILGFFYEWKLQVLNFHDTYHDEFNYKIN